MENVSKLMMDKHMLNNKGFSLVEILFVVSVIIALSLLTLTIRPVKISETIIVNNVTLFINQAKTHAMVFKENVDIKFNKNKVTATSSTFNRTYQLSRGSFTQHNLSFNKFGHIVNPKSVYLYFGEKEYKFVFQIGSGSFYVQ